MDSAPHTVMSVIASYLHQGEHMIRGKKPMARRLVLLLPLASSCALLSGREVPAERADPPTQQDSVSVTAMSLYRLVRDIDAEGRTINALPSWLSNAQSTRRQSLMDAWGRLFDIQVRGVLYEIRSAGPDGLRGTDDDISAIGKLGRILPCEVRRLGHVARFEEVAPSCDETTSITIYPLCDALKYSGAEHMSVPPPDSVVAEGQHLIRVAWIIDGYGRELSTLPLELRNIPLPGQNAHRELIDLWNNVVGYTRSSSDFELRSPGRDRSLGSQDDIVVTGVLGTPVQCSFRVGGEVRSCTLSPPLCSTS